MEGARESTNLIVSGLGERRIKIARTNVARGRCQLAERTRDIEQTSIFFPAIDHQNATPSLVGDFSVMKIDATQKVNMVAKCPANMVSLTSLAVVMIPDTSETIQADIQTSMAQVTQAHTTHQGDTANATKDVTVNLITEWDISNLSGGINFPTAALAGDYIAVEFHSDTTDIRVLGLELVCDLGR